MRLERERHPAAGSDDPNAIYDEQYYRAGLGPFPYLRDARWLGFFASVADNLVRIFAPRTAFDAGCAMGMLVESLWDRGVAAQGIDVSAYALSCVRPDMREHCRYGSIVAGAEGRFDVVTCIEVLEHLPPETTAAAVANLCRLADTVVFSSSPGDFDEPTHVNVRPPLEWVRLFARNGFRADLAVDATFIAPHALVFRRADGYDDGEVEAFVARQAALRTALGERDKELADLRTANETASAQTRAREAQVKAGEANSAAVQGQLAAVEAQLESLATQL
ncbi:MAG: class I SAM-dependent methyltransferase, partial [Candidatus Eremiobacteraeota bacterium]|nr:class I SAM-dependent methyltransferase [Candidatus Eremiobacteraeota bacterium]